MEEHTCELKRVDGFLDLLDGLELYQCTCGKSEKRPRKVTEDKPPLDTSTD